MKRLSDNAMTQTVKVVPVERKKVSMLVLFGSVAAVCGFTTVATRSANTEQWSPSRAKVEQKIENAAAYQRFAQALALLEQGNNRQARQLLDSVRDEQLVINAGGMGDGMLRSYSPTTLLMGLTKRLARNAEGAAKAGNAAEAQMWLKYNAQIAEQVAQTPQPNADAFCLSHFIDVYMTNTQGRVAGLLGDTSAQVAAQQRCDFLKRTWLVEVLPQLKDNGVDVLSVADGRQSQLRRIQNRYSFYRMQAGLTAA